MGTDGKSLNNPPNNIIPARSGFTGAVAYEILGVPYMIRAESCDVIVKQDIQTIGDVDGSIDYTRYMLQPFDVSGSLSFPLDQSQAADSFAVFEKLYNDAVLRRSEDGNLRSKNEGGRRLHVRYYPGFSYTYLDILINSFQLSVSQGDVLKATVNMMGRGRIPMDPSDAPTLDATSDLAPVRAIQFNDVEVVIVPDGDIGGISEEISTEIVRSFEVTINNNCEHVYTLSSSLTPYDIIAKKREITGSITFAGRQDDLALWASEHETRAQSAVDLVFRVKMDAATTIDLFRLKGVIAQIESAAITNDLVETSMNFRAFGHQNFNFEAISGFNDTDNSANDGILPFGI
tara:strand:- start:3290 stop:4327 length:1038 start_codon:yes stop_codon:yes gene_type:complete